MVAYRAENILHVYVGLSQWVATQGLHLGTFVRGC